MYVWGQLDLPRGEKRKRKQTIITSPTTPLAFAPDLVSQEKRGAFAPAGYKVEIKGDAGIVEHHLAVVGRPLEIEIIPRDRNIGSSSCMVRTRLLVLNNGKKEK